MAEGVRNHGLDARPINGMVHVMGGLLSESLTPEAAIATAHRLFEAADQAIRVRSAQQTSAVGTA
jgi:hypothetical protein